MKRSLVIGIIIILLGILLFTNRRELYCFGKRAWNSIENKNISKKKHTEYLWGIDISHHQGKIDWDKLVKQNKPDFIFLKCTEGKTYQDKKYDSYRKAANKRGIVIGGYHFFSYQSSGKEQALNFIKNAKLKKGDLYPVLDIEYKKKRPKNGEIRHQVREFCKLIKKEYGVNPIIYCEYVYYRNILQCDFEDFDYWISDLRKEPKMDYAFWQYTAKGFVKGIGSIDNNRLNPDRELKDFILK